MSRNNDRLEVSPTFFPRLSRLRRMPMARDRLQHTDAVALGVGERDIVPHTRYLHRLTEYLAASLCDSPDRVCDIFHRNNDGWVLRWPIGLFRKKAAVNRTGFFGALLIGFSGRGKNVVTHILIKQLRLPTKC